MRQHLLAFVMFASMLPFSAAQGQQAVQSQEGITLENQILQLQQQVQNMGAGNGSGSSLGGSSSPAPAPDAASGATPPDSSIITSLLTQVQQLQAQVQTLNGQVDTLQNQVNTQHDATEKEIGDLKFAMTNGAAGAAAPAAGAAAGAAAGTLAPAPPAPAAAAPAAPSSSPKATLKAGQLALHKGDFPTAEADARAVLAAAKSSPEGYEAGLLLPESLYAQHRPQDAAIAFDDEYNRARSGTNAPAALLGLANSLTAIHQTSAACDTLSSLNSQFPTPPKGMRARIDAASQRAHCS